METIVSLLQLLSAFDALGWLNGLTFLGVAKSLFVFACWWVVIGIGIIGPLFVGYVFLTHLQKVKKANGGKLTPFVWLVSALPGLTAGLLDVAFQFGWAPFLFWDFVPRHLTLSQRMTRYWKGEDGWRRRVVGQIKVKTMIDNFDFSGQHIG